MVQLFPVHSPPLLSMLHHYKEISGQTFVTQTTRYMFTVDKFLEPVAADQLIRIMNSKVENCSLTTNVIRTSQSFLKRMLMHTTICSLSSNNLLPQVNTWRCQSMTSWDYIIA